MGFLRLRVRPRSTHPLRWLGALFCCTVAAFLLVPIVLGWKQPTLSRQQVVEGAQKVVGSSRVEAKLVHLDSGVPELSGLVSLAQRYGDDVWVVASTSWKLGESCDAPCQWPLSGGSSWLVFDRTDAVRYEGLFLGFGSRGAWPPFFDRLRDEAAPSWWPRIPPTPVGLDLTAASLVAGLALLWPVGTPHLSRFRSMAAAGYARVSRSQGQGRPT